MDADAQTRGTEQRAQKWTHVSEVNCSVTKGQEHTTGGGGEGHAPQCMAWGSWAATCETTHGTPVSPAPN